MKKKKFGEVLRELLGWTREKTITTYDESGEAISIKTITTKLSYFQIIAKLFTGLMIVVIIISILTKLYAFFLRSKYLPFDPARPDVFSYFFNPFDIIFLIFLIWIYSKIDDDDDHMDLIDDDEE